MALDYPRPIWSGPQSSELIVLLHGWGYPFDRLRDLKTTISKQYPDADLLIPRYGASWGSDRWIHKAAPRRSPFVSALRWMLTPVRRSYEFARNFACWISSQSATKVASDLNNAIEEAVLERIERSGTSESPEGYKEIILIGHSVGALVLRKAFVYGLGQTQDRPGVAQSKKTWPGLVKRMVLMASMDRGWVLDRKPEYMNKVSYWFFRLILRPARLLGLGKLIFAFARGSPFIVNLRIQWVNLSTELKTYPLTILMIGKYDNMMDEEDHQDLLMASGQLINLEVTSDGTERSKQTGHYDLLRFTEGPGHDAGTCQKRKRLFEKAIASKPENIPSTPIPNKHETEVERVIFLMHGIRDFGNWVDRMHDKIYGLCDTDQLPRKSIKAIKEKYDYFSSLDFLLTRHRRNITRKFMDHYAEAVATFPNARERFGFVGHSHGTHQLAQAMSEYKACRFERVVLTGSVVDRDFDWDEFVKEQRLDGLRNDVATHDYVVGLFPAFNEQMRRVRGRKRRELGSGGLTGFTAKVANRHQQTVCGGHSMALDPSNHESIILYLTKGPDASDRAFPDALRPRKPDQNLQWLTKIALPVRVVIVAIVLAITFFAAKGAAAFVASHPSWPLLGTTWAVLLAPCLVAILVLGLIWFLLDTF